MNGSHPRQAITAELQGADNDVEATVCPTRGRRVPRVVEAPQEALQLQRQDAMRDAENMATQVPWPKQFISNGGFLMVL